MELLCTISLRGSDAPMRRESFRAEPKFFAADDLLHAVLFLSPHIIGSQTTGSLPRYVP